MLPLGLKPRSCNQIHKPIPLGWRKERFYLIFYEVGMEIDKSELRLPITSLLFISANEEDKRMDL